MTPKQARTAYQIPDSTLPPFNQFIKGTTHRVDPDTGVWRPIDRTRAIDIAFLHVQYARALRRERRVKGFEG